MPVGYVCCTVRTGHLLGMPDTCQRHQQTGAKVAVFVRANALRI
jgi:hypothetical protein